MHFDEPTGADYANVNAQKANERVKRLEEVIALLITKLPNEEDRKEVMDVLYPPVKKVVPKTKQDQMIERVEHMMKMIKSKKATDNDQQ